MHLIEDEYATKALELVESGQGLCAICYRHEDVTDYRTGEPRALNRDHCHSTGSFRGLLCTGCNRGLGYFRDSPELLERAARYLRDARST